MKLFLLSIGFMLCAVTVTAQRRKCSLQDFNALIGSWKGSLTYLDYSSGKPYTMRADLEVSAIQGSGNLLFANLYPNEPKANSADTFRISPDGKFIDQERVISRKKSKDGSLEIITQTTGVDGNDHQEAIIKHVYNISPSYFSIRKEVRFNNEKDFIKRHEYAYSKKQ